MRVLWTAVALLALGVSDAGAGVLDRAKETGELRIAYRDDAQPFSFTDAHGKAAGYSVALCEAVAREAAAEIGSAELKLTMVEVGAADRLTPWRTARPTSCARPRP